jgi:hypothetical protein
LAEHVDLVRCKTDAIVEAWNLFDDHVNLEFSFVRVQYSLFEPTASRGPEQRFLSDGRFEIDSNIVERAIRPQTITGKNAHFAGSRSGGRTWATIATLLQTAKMNDVDPHAWPTQTLERIARGWPISQIDALMPWHFKA